LADNKVICSMSQFGKRLEQSEAYDPGVRHAESIATHLPAAVQIRSSAQRSAQPSSLLSYARRFSALPSSAHSSLTVRWLYALFAVYISVFFSGNGKKRTKGALEWG
jgi:hypothetical protein